MTESPWGRWMGEVPQKLIKVPEMPQIQMGPTDEFELTSWLTVDGIEVKRWWTAMPTLEKFLKIFDRDCGVLMGRAEELPKDRLSRDPDQVPEIELIIWFEMHGVKFSDTLETIDPETCRLFIRATFEAWGSVNGS